MNNHVGTVGIIIPMYNARQTILRAVQSVIDQTYPDWHIYLVNDKSTDDSLAFVREHCQDARITILDNDVNMGAAETETESPSPAHNRWSETGCSAPASPLTR